MPLNWNISLSEVERRLLLKILCISVLTLNLFSAVVVVTGLWYVFRPVHDLDCWPVFDGDNQYIVRPEIAAQEMGFGDQRYEPHIYLSSCSSEACCDIVPLRGLRANIGVLIWPKNGLPSYYTNRDNLTNKIEPDRALIGIAGVAYVWPLDKVSSNVLESNPELAIRFHRRKK